MVCDVVSLIMEGGRGSPKSLTITRHGYILAYTLLVDYLLRLSKQWVFHRMAPTKRVDDIDSSSSESQSRNPVLTIFEDLVQVLRVCLHEWLDESLEHDLVAALLLDEEEEADFNGRLLYHSRGELGGLEGSFRNTFSWLTSFDVPTSGRGTGSGRLIPVLVSHLRTVASIHHIALVLQVKLESATITAALTQLLHVLLQHLELMTVFVITEPHHGVRLPYTRDPHLTLNPKACLVQTPVMLPSTIRLDIQYQETLLIQQLLLLPSIPTTLTNKEPERLSKLEEEDGSITLIQVKNLWHNQRTWDNSHYCSNFRLEVKTFSVCNALEIYKKRDSEISWIKWLSVEFSYYIRPKRRIR